MIIQYENKILHTTPCPNGGYFNVGSSGCVHCKYFGGYCLEPNTIECNYNADEIAEHNRIKEHIEARVNLLRGKYND
jgi:hypothetical protein